MQPKKLTANRQIALLPYRQQNASCLYVCVKTAYLWMPVAIGRIPGWVRPSCLSGWHSSSSSSFWSWILSRSGHSGLLLRVPALKQRVERGRGPALLRYGLSRGDRGAVWSGGATHHGLLRVAVVHVRAGRWVASSSSRRRMGTGRAAGRRGGGSGGRRSRPRSRGRAGGAVGRRRGRRRRGRGGRRGGHDACPLGTHLTSLDFT